MDRRRFLFETAGWLTGFAVGTACGSRSVRAGQEAKPRPNVMIAVDDLNDWIGVLGRRQDVKTPNIDRLAKRGVVFTRAYCAAPSCNPSRTALLTGVRPSTSGIYENDNPWRPVLPNAVTLPQYFLKHGYDVLGGGKIFHNSYNDKASWQQWFNPPKFPEPAKVPANGLNAAHFDWSPVDVPDEEMGDFKVVSWAIERWKEKREKPLFLAVGLIRPHLPWFAPKKYFDMYPLESIKRPEVKEDDLADIPAEGRRLATRSGDHRKVVAAGQWEKAIQGYLASITFADAQIGRLLDALDADPRGKETIIILWSDHGWNLGEKEHWRKFALWEETTRVTLIAVAPGVTPEGATCERTVGLMDIYPTLTELCGLPKKDGIEADSLVPLLKNPGAAWDRPALTTYLRGNHAVRSERWRYIRYHDGGEELYDHNADPREWTNLASDPKYAVIKKDLARWLPKTDAPTAPTRAPARQNPNRRNPNRRNPPGPKKP
jgi:arylsulfatase A-like enzyme